MRTSVPPTPRASDAAFPAHLTCNHKQNGYSLSRIFPRKVLVKMGWSPLMVVALAALAGAQETCLSVNDNPYLLFGAKTAYIFANRGLSAQRAHDVPGCTPVAFWMLSRHGSHNPEADEIERLQTLISLRDKIFSNYQSGLSDSNHHICLSDLNLLRQWNWNPKHNLSYAGDLTSEGYLSQQQLAQAWKNKYPSLFSDNNYNYLFKYAEGDKRSALSFRAFSEGLFKTMVENYDLPRENNETTLKPYNNCPAWKSDVEENQDTLSHRHIFESKQEYKDMIHNVSLRLGFKYDLSPENVSDIYQMCRYNKAWDVTKISPWCAAFTREELRLLEYAEDLETYYKYGYGKELNKKVGCSYVKDMMSFFSKHVENEQPQQPNVMVHFSEAPAILLALGAMGAHQDPVPLTGDNYHSAAMQARKWTTSNMSPFDANIAAVLHKCNLNGNFQVNEQYQVLLLENEKPSNLDWCRVGLCEWSQVVKNFGEVAKTCDLEACNSATAITSTIGVALAAFVVRFVML